MSRESERLIFRFLFFLLFVFVLLGGLGLLLLLLLLEDGLLADGVGELLTLGLAALVGTELERE